MTEFETAYMFNEIVNTSTTWTVNFNALLFAFLIASVMSAERLSRGMVVVALFIYSSIVIIMLYQFTRLMTSFVNLALQAKAMANETGSGIAWMAVRDIPEWSVDATPFIVLVWVTMYIASLYFFRECRAGKFRL